MAAHLNFWAMLNSNSSNSNSTSTDHLMVQQQSVYSNNNLPGLTYSPSSASGHASSSSPMSASLQLHGDASSTLKDSIAASLSQGTESAQQTAMDRALAAGISRDEYERTRAGLMDMLRGKQNALSSSADTSSEDLSLPSQTMVASNPSSAPSSGKRASTNNNSNSRRPGASLTSISTTSTQLSDSSAPSASTLRTSASSSAAFTDPDNPTQLRHESPPTSEEGDTVGKNTSGGSREGDNSFNAASAAAAALGMLAASPIKHDSRFSNNKQQQHHGSNFTTHRHVVPPSSPPMRSNSYLSSSGGANEHGFLRTSPGSRSPDPASGSGRGKSTTPVRTRLEDIALKSSAQIRRQRERLGLGEQEEMMDLDTDARHLSSMSHLMQGSLSDNDSDGGHGGEGADSSFEDAQYDPALAATSHQARSLGSGLAPAFSLSPGRAAVPAGPHERGAQGNHAAFSSHRRTPSYGVSNSRNQGMLDRFMEISSSPKAAATAARRSPEQQQQQNRYPGYGAGIKEENGDEFDDDEELGGGGHARYRTLDYTRGTSTPKTSVDRRAALLRVSSSSRSHTPSLG